MLDNNILAKSGHNLTLITIKMDSYQNDAIALLPEEVWKCVLDFAVAENDQTFLNCNLTCRLWYQILKEFIFRLKFAKVLPYVYPYLPGSDILNCRLVSKKWFTAVTLCNSKVEPKIKVNINRHDEQIMDDIIHYFPDRIILRLPHHFVGISGYIPEHDILLHQRLRNIRDVRSSFIFNSLCLSVSHDMANRSVFMENIPNLEETRALELHLSHGLIQHNKFNLLDILLKFPFLEYLKLTTTNPTEVMLPQVFSSLRLLQLPKLKTLNVTQLPRAFAEHLISHFKSTLLANNHEKLAICHVLCRQENLFWWKGPIKILSAQLEQRFLTHAHFSIASESCPPCKFEDEINHYKNTLRVLSIKWIGLKQRAARLSGEMGLNGININWSSRDSVASSFEFLKDLRNLEQLKIQFEIEEYKKLSQSKKNIDNSLFIIDFENNLEEIEDLMDDDIVIRKMYKSNIWSLLPKLKCVCISIFNDEQMDGDIKKKRVYTRRELNELFSLNFY